MSYADMFFHCKEQFIYDLPARLGKCIKSEAYADAVRFYNGAMPIFKVNKFLLGPLMVQTISMLISTFYYVLGALIVLTVSHYNLFQNF